jgi:transposase
VLQKSAPGGKIVDYDCHIPDAIADPEQVAYVTPVYIRGGESKLLGGIEKADSYEGAIIPQLDVRQWVKEGDLNSPTIHVYPGGKTTVSTTPAIKYFALSVLAVILDVSRRRCQPRQCTHRSAPAQVQRRSSIHQSKRFLPRSQDHSGTFIPHCSPTIIRTNIASGKHQNKP